MAAVLLTFWNTLNWLFGSVPRPRNSYLYTRWLFLRGLGLIFFSAFYPLLFQIRGLMGPNGILPAGHYLEAVSRYFGPWKFWYAPTVLWLRSGNAALMAICWIGLCASVLLIFNLWPRATLLVCFVMYLSFVAAAQDFSGYQSDGMLLASGFIALFFAPPGFHPGLGESKPPSRASLFLLQWVWFRIYFESGVAKIASGDPEWRHLTAMDHYYQNGPLPTWIGWYVQHFPHPFHVATAAATLLLELILAWMLFFPRRIRMVCFFIVTPWEIAVILTANYTFLNYLVLLLGVLLLDDRFIEPIWKRLRREKPDSSASAELSTPDAPREDKQLAGLRHRLWLQRVSLVFSAFMLSWISYSSTAQLIQMVAPASPLPAAPIRALDPLRIANQYGLFAVMTRGRFEIEFQGSDDGGQTWTPYPFRYKPQSTHEAPRIYAPYQPRFDWNLWFASLGTWRQYPIVPLTEERLLTGSPEVLSLFAGNPFPEHPPQQVRAVLWQYWFTDLATKRSTGEWWRREFLGLYAPTLEREPDGRIVIEEMPSQPLPLAVPPGGSSSE